MESVTDSCLICSPYITMTPVRELVSVLGAKGVRDTARVRVVTDVSPMTLANSSTDIEALIYLSENVRHVQTVYLPRIHAKVISSGDRLAIVGSANFTEGGFSGNLEYGVLFSDPNIVRSINADIEEYAALGSIVAPSHLSGMRERIAQLRTAIADEQRSISSKVREASAELQREVADHLLKVRVEGKTAHGIFSDTIRYLLARGAMTTQELEQRIREIHPDICDDALDRVIDGEHFGKLWKHQVRTAQQHLKRRGLAIYDANRRKWQLNRPERAG
jgi:hypothetical protein